MKNWLKTNWLGMYTTTTQNRLMWPSVARACAISSVICSISNANGKPLSQVLMKCVLRDLCSHSFRLLCLISTQCGVVPRIDIPSNPNPFYHHNWNQTIFCEKLRGWEKINSIYIRRKFKHIIYWPLVTSFAVNMSSLSPSLLFSLQTGALVYFGTWLLAYEAC